MKKTERILKLFEDLYDGTPWIDVTIRGTLANVNATQAAKKMVISRNSIWEIVNHLVNWRLTVLQRLMGKEIASPETNYFETIKDTSDDGWRRTMEQLTESQRQWIHFLKTFSEADFEKVYPSNQMTHYEHIHGILQHDAYHLGQLALLAKLV